MKSVPLLVVCLNIFSILSSSWGQYCGYNDPDPATGLSPRQKRVLRTTWDIVNKDPLGSGEAVLLEYLSRYPSYQLVFKTFDRVPYADLAKNPAFRKLSLAVMESLTNVVDSLDKPEILVKILLDLGEDHKQLGVTKKQYIDLADTMAHVLGVALGEKWNQEANATWVQALDTINSIIFKVYK